MKDRPDRDGRTATRVPPCHHRITPVDPSKPDPDWDRRVADAQEPLVEFE